MEKNKYLKYCKYYKGEETIPENMNYNHFGILNEATSHLMITTTKTGNILICFQCASINFQKRKSL